MKKAKRKRNIFSRWIVFFIVLAFACNGVINLYNKGAIHINYPSPENYPVRGVDVSNYQGEIDWETLVKQDVSFAFIKVSSTSTNG